MKIEGALLFRVIWSLQKKVSYFAQDDFWCQVLWGPAQGPCPALDTLGKAEICDLKKVQKCVLI